MTDRARADCRDCPATGVDDASLIHDLADRHADAYDHRVEVEPVDGGAGE